MHDTLASAVRDRVDAHLDAVEKQLEAAGANRTKRRGVLDDLETQILDMLAARNAGSPTLTDVDAVLASLDPPSAYANSGSVPADSRRPATTAVVVEPRLCPAVKKGTRYLAVALIGALLLILAKAESDVEYRSGASPPPSIAIKALLVGAGLALAVGPFLVTVFGWIATERIRRSGGQEYGLGLAVIEALFFPILIIWVAAFALAGPGAGFIEHFAAPVLLTAALGFFLRWSTGPKSNPSSSHERSNGERQVPLASN
jgi:hypothetical protein